MQRLNVAITRAQHALWIVGNAATLAASPGWAELLMDARQRGLVVEHSTAEGHFRHSQMHARAAVEQLRQQLEI